MSIMAIRSYRKYTPIIMKSLELKRYFEIVFWKIFHIFEIYFAVFSFEAEYSIVVLCAIAKLEFGLITVKYLRNW